MLFRYLTWAISGQPGYMLTSRPYGREIADSVQMGEGALVSMETTYIPPPPDPIEYSLEPEAIQTGGGALESGKYGDWGIEYEEGISMSVGGLESGKYGDQHIDYTEQIRMTSGNGLESGIFGDILINNYQEGLQMGQGGLVSGTN